MKKNYDESDYLDTPFIQGRINGAIDRVSDINMDEELMLQKISNGRELSYRQFVYIFHNNADIQIAQQKIGELYRLYPILRTVYIRMPDNSTKRVVISLPNYLIPIRDISDRPVAEQQQLLKNLTAAESRRYYNPGEGNIIRTLILKLGEAEYVFILSICNYPRLELNGMQLLEHLFGLKQIKPRYRNLYEKKSRIISRGYWNKLLGEKLEPTPMPNIGEEKKAVMADKRTANDKEIARRESSINLLPADINDAITSYQKINNQDVRSILLIAWGLMLGQYYSRKKIILGIHWNSEEMKLAPLVIDCNLSLNALVNMVTTQLSDISRYDNCNEAEISDYLGMQESRYFTTRHRFLDMEDVAQLIGTNSLCDEALALDCDAEIDNRITVVYNMYEREMSIQYEFDTDYYDMTSIANLHSTYVKVLNKLMHLATELYLVNLDAVELTSFRDTGRESSEASQKAYYMKRSGIFGVLSSEELLLMSSQCRLRVLLSEDVIINEGANVDKFYIIGEGNIEVSKVGVDGYIKSIKVSSAPDIFGIEGLLSTSISEASYTVISNTATILEIPRTLMGSSMNKHPGIWKDILEYQTNELQKFHKLWIID